MNFKLSATGFAVLVLACAGCGELVNGANLKPTVKYKPDSSAVPVAATAEAPATTEVVASAGGVGTLRGKVEYVGVFAELAPIFAQGNTSVKDAEVCSAVAIPDQSIVVKDGGLANVFIYRKKPLKVPGATLPEAKLIFDQKNCVFKPHAMIMRVGQTVSVLNSDAVTHNTHTNTIKARSFNKVVNPNDTVGVPLVYNLAEQDPIQVVCDVHSWMKAYHLPVDHPFAAVSGEDGTFEIKDLPAGEHEFKVWHEAGGLLQKSLIVTIKPGDNDLPIKVTPAQLGR